MLDGPENSAGVVDTRFVGSEHLEVLGRNRIGLLDGAGDGGELAGFAGFALLFAPSLPARDADERGPGQQAEQHPGVDQRLHLVSASWPGWLASAVLAEP